MTSLLILVLLLCCGLRAQVAGGNVSGVVTDPSGASIPRAKVVLRNLATQIVRTVNANVEGFYAAPNLVPGEYKVTVSAVGFETQASRFTLTIGAEGELNFALRIGSVDQTMEVEGPAAGIGLATSRAGAGGDERNIEGCAPNRRSRHRPASPPPARLSSVAHPFVPARTRRRKRG